MDTDGNGIIDEHEIQSVLETCSDKAHRSITYCKELIEEIDQDGDGKINYEEFLDVPNILDIPVLMHYDSQRKFQSHA